MIKIIQKGNKILNTIAKEVVNDEIKTSKIKKVLSDMKKAMYSQDDAIAIAAPQINIPMRIFAVSGKILSQMQEIDENKKNTHDKKEESFENDLIFINPKIIKHSKKITWSEEGCLSIRWWYGEVKRYKNITISAYDENGNLFKRGAGGLLAQIFQHEIDHLDGILFDSKAKNLHETELESSEEGNSQVL